MKIKNILGETYEIAAEESYGIWTAVGKGIFFLVLLVAGTVSVLWFIPALGAIYAVFIVLGFMFGAAAAYNLCNAFYLVGMQVGRLTYYGLARPDKMFPVGKLFNVIAKSKESTRRGDNWVVLEDEHGRLHLGTSNYDLVKKAYEVEVIQGTDQAYLIGIDVDDAEDK